MVYVYLKVMDEEGLFYWWFLLLEGSQKIYFVQQIFEINKFKYFMKIIVERGEFGEILLYLVGCEQGICIRDMF